VSRAAIKVLSWIVLFPLVTTTLIIVIDYFKGNSIEFTSYLPGLFGFAVGGIFTSILMYYVQKLKEKY
jgi:hypothetical protein